MAYLYLIRHAQAGSRDNYDLLSDLGREQARLLGEHFAESEIQFDGVYSGSLIRQRETAEIARASAMAAGELIIDERLNEFNLAEVYRFFGPRLLEADPQFVRDVDEMREVLRKDPHATGGATGRSDLAVIRAWVENRYPGYHGESWNELRNRIRRFVAEGPLANGARSVAVFTSATPIAILAGAALGLDTEKLLGILGVVYNSSVTVIRAKDDLRLFTFNSVSHLGSALRTLR